MSEKKDKKYIFESAPVPRAVLAMAVPTVITQLINIVYNFADTWFVGRTGDPAMVAAMGVAMPLYVIMAAIANLFGIGASSAISRSLGQGKPERAQHVFAFGFWGGMAAALVYMLIIYFFRAPLIMLVGGDEADFAYLYDYMFWTMSLGGIPTVGNVLCGHLIRSTGDARAAGFGMSLGGVLNIFLDPLFMFVILPPGKEVTGAAIATLLSNTAALVYFLVYILRRREDPVMTLHPGDISLEDGIPGDVLMIGLPAAMSTTLAMVSNIAANVLVRSCGSGAVAGMGVAKKINMIGFNTCLGATQGVLPLIGYCYGAKNFKRMKAVIRFTGIMVLVYGCLCTLFFRSCAGPLVRFFIDDQGAVSYGRMFLRIIAFASPLASFSYMISTVFQATGRKWQSFLLSILRKGLLDIPFMILLRGFYGAGGVVWATPLAEVLSVGIALLLYFRMLKALKGESAGASAGL